MNNKLRILTTKFYRPIILVAFMLILTIAAPNSFPTIANLSNVFWSLSIVGIMVSGSIFAILIGGIDLSVGSIVAMTGIICVKTIIYYNYSTTGLIIGICLALLFGLIVGLVHGIIITVFEVPAFLITFATQIIVLGMAMLLSSNKIISCTNPKIFTSIGIGKFLGIPIPIYIMLVIALISFFILNKTVLGRQMYAVGGNPLASELSGINSKKIIIMAYMLSSFTAAIGGIVLSSVTQQGMAANGAGYETEVITAAVIGGTSLMGGEGSIQGAIFGAIIVGLVNNGLNLLDVPSIYHGLVKGFVIIIAVAIDAYTHGDKKWKIAFLRKKTA